jgi:formylglycine-generating enzyme required for sulfatase activity
MGFSIQTREVEEGRAWTIHKSRTAFARPVLVLCQDGMITKHDVEEMRARIKGQDQNIGNGVCVAHTRVSPVARELAARTNGTIKVFTLNEFYRELIDFQEYIRFLIDDFENDEVNTYYVDLGCESTDGSRYKPIDDYVDDWLRDPTLNHISILGEYGSGKTSFCRHYASVLGKRWLNDPDNNRIPLLITLRDYSKAMNLQQLVTDFLVNQCGIQVGFDAFRRFNADGRLIIIFDGFDEMAQKVDVETTDTNFEELAKIVESQSKVILTCRSSYFKTRDEAEALLANRGKETAQPNNEQATKQSIIDPRNRPNFEIVELLPFDRVDIQQILKARFPKSWEEYWHQITHTYNLQELAHRPVLLDMILQSLPELEPSNSINAAQLYDIYTDLWLDRDEQKGRTLITREHKSVFMQSLALEMRGREELKIHYSKLPKRVQEYFKLEMAQEVDYFEHDIRTCSFLNRDDEGYYRFAHKSFQEFFIAQWLANKLLNGTAPRMAINVETIGFVQGLLESEDWPTSRPANLETSDEMIWIPAGPYITDEEQVWEDYDLFSEESYFIREVFKVITPLTHNFLVSRTPVTNAQYAYFVAETGYPPPIHWNGTAPPESLLNHPVVYVDWYDALAYAEWAGVTLLTEKEWEKAARGIDGRDYPWGNEFNPDYCNTQESRIETTVPVDHHSPEGNSKCGCVSMSGNVWEWTSDVLSKGRVLRGGSFMCGRDFAQLTYRLVVPPFFKNWSCGFRVGKPFDTESNEVNN